MSNPSNSKTRFQELHEAHQDMLSQYLPPAAKKQYDLEKQSKNVYEDTRSRSEKTLKLDRLFLEKEHLNEMVGTSAVEDTAELTKIMKRIKEIDAELNESPK